MRLVIFVCMEIKPAAGAIAWPAVAQSVYAATASRVSMVRPPR